MSIFLTLAPLPNARSARVDYVVHLISSCGILTYWRLDTGATPKHHSDSSLQKQRPLTGTAGFRFVRRGMAMVARSARAV